MLLLADEDQHPSSHHGNSNETICQTTEIFLPPCGLWRIDYCRSILHNAFSLLVGNPRPAYQKAVRIYSVRRTGDQCYIVAGWLNGQLGCIFRQNGIDFHHHIGQCFIQNFQVKNISGLKFVQIGEYPLPGKAGMPGYYTVCSGSAHGKRGTEKVTKAMIQCLLVRSVIDGEITSL